VLASCSFREPYPVETRSIVALFPTLEQAEKAEAGLRAAGVPSRDIALSAQVASFGEAGTRVAPAPAGNAQPHEKSYFEWLVGAQVDDTRILRYRELLDAGAGLVCVRVPALRAAETRRILHGCGPIDLGARTADEAYAGAKPGVGGWPRLDEYVIGG